MNGLHQGPVANPKCGAHDGALGSLHDAELLSVALAGADSATAGLGGFMFRPRS